MYLGPLRLNQRKGHFEPAALSESALDADRTAVEFHQMLGDGQAEACAFAPYCSGASHLIELIEN